MSFGRLRWISVTDKPVEWPLTPCCLMILTLYCFDLSDHSHTQLIWLFFYFYFESYIRNTGSTDQLSTRLENIGNADQDTDMTVEFGVKTNANESKNFLCGIHLNCYLTKHWSQFVSAKWHYIHYITHCGFFLLDALNYLWKSESSSWRENHKVIYCIIFLILMVVERP